jgi:hypothetical protein
MRDQRANRDIPALVLDAETMARFCPLIVLALALSRPALADEPDGINGFVTYGSGDMTGRVVDLDGKPLRNTEVHVVPDVGSEVVVKTDKDGRFKAKLSGQSNAVVYVRAKARITAHVSIPSPDDPDGEVVEIHETLPPAVMPKAFQDRTIIPPYSQQAMQKNVWVRAHVMLDVDALGQVKRIKMLNAPGYDLDAIAIKEAFALGFTPAKDRSGNSVPAMVVWTFEWPAFWWLKGKPRAGNRMPAEAAKVPCKGDGASTVYRDCSTPAVAKAINLPWLEPSGARSPNP